MLVNQLYVNEVILCYYYVSLPWLNSFAVVAYQQGYVHVHPNFILITSKSYISF